MPTPTMSDEELDSVFRRVADEYPHEVPPPAAWERLETQLATATTTQQLRGKVLRGLGAEAATLAVVFWLAYQLLPQPARVGRLPAVARPVTTRPVARPLPAPAAPEAAPATAPASLPRLATGSTGTWASPAPLPTAAGSGPPAAAADRRPRPGVTPVARGWHVRESQAFASENKLLVTSGRARKAAKERAAPRAPGLAEAPETSRAARLALGSYPLPDAIGGLAVLPLADSSQQPKRPVQRPPFRLVVGLLGAPAFSAVRTPQSAQLGADYGLTLEYVLATRLRVRAGLISSQKRYRAASTDYVAPASWQWYPGDYQLDANCRITELPLDVRFDVLRRPSYAVFTSLGINSLLMRNERYSYDWTVNGHTYTNSAQVLAGSNHFLSVLNVAVGIERPIGGRWSAQVEPFWQVPLGGVGAGQVRLSSAGAAFSLKFGLIR